MKTFKFYADAGHGWLAVKRPLLADMGLLDKISSYSYQRGGTVYLEEDADASLFVEAYGRQNMTIKRPNKWPDRSPIRSYDSFIITES